MLLDHHSMFHVSSHDIRSGQESGDKTRVFRIHYRKVMNIVLHHEFEGILQGSIGVIVIKFLAITLFTGALSVSSPWLERKYPMVIIPAR